MEDEFLIVGLISFAVLEITKSHYFGLGKYCSAKLKFHIVSSGSPHNPLAIQLRVYSGVSFRVSSSEWDAKITKSPK